MTNPIDLLEPDRGQLERFVGDLFRHAEGEGFFSVRAFFDNEAESRPFRIQSVPLAAGLPYLIDNAEDIARRAANEVKKIVFCPPLGAFSNPTQAREQDLLAGFVLSVECDERPRQALATLAAIIGPPTMIVRSGGRWTDPATGQAHNKLHLHWRLAHPARGDDLPKLKKAREIATGIVGGDASNIPTVHPIRWPGSWHRKGEPVLCEIEDADPDREIDLSAALELLESAAPAPPRQGNGAATLAAIIDDGRRSDWAALTANIIAGRDLHESTARLAASHAALGMSAEHSLRILRSLMLTSAAPHDERWQARFSDLGRIVRSGAEKFGPAQEQQPEITSPNEGKAFGYSWQWKFHGDVDPIDSRPALVEGLLPDAGVGLIAGQWGVYKTFVADDLAAAVMTGGVFIKFPVRRKGAVLFFACEGQSEVGIRLTAAYEARGGTGRAPFAWVDTCPRLLDPNAHKIITAMVKHAAEHMMREFGLPVVLVIIDTAGKAAGYMKNGEENDAATAKQIMKTLAAASLETNALYLGVAHFGKAIETGTRGSSSFEDDSDVVLALLGEKGINGAVTNPRLCARKRRSGPNGEDFPFRTRVVQMGVDQHGVPITTLVIEWLPEDEANPAAAKPKADQWSKSLRLLRQVLMNMLADSGSNQKPYPDGPTVRAVDLESVRSEFYKSHPATGDAKAKADARRQAFARAVRDAQAKGLIGTRDIGAVTFVWLAVPETPHKRAYRWR
jgi:hypothetical protein